MKRIERVKYQILNRDGTWTNCTSGQPHSTGWLSYSLSDGTNGVKRPGTWRVKPEKK
jgi:hypothetical protein